MKKLTMVILSLMICLFFSAGAALADTNGEAVASATVYVDPNITLGQAPAAVDMATVQTGVFDGTFTFRVDANMQYVHMQVEVTKLYKGTEPTSDNRIPVAVDVPVVVDPDCATGESLDLSESYAGTIGGLESTISASSEFESGQSGHFSCDVPVVCSWNQDDPERPTGDYGGFVKLIAWITPTT